VHEREAIDLVEQQENLDQEAIGEIEFDLSLGHKQPYAPAGKSSSDLGLSDHHFDILKSMFEQEHLTPAINSVWRSHSCIHYYNKHLKVGQYGLIRVPTQVHTICFCFFHSFSASVTCLCFLRIK